MRWLLFFNGGGFLMYLKLFAFFFKEVGEIMVMFIEWERRIYAGINR